LLGMRVGDKKTVQIPVRDAYGPVDPDMVMEFPLNRLPPDMKPEIGMQLTLSNESGQSFPVMISEIKEDSVLLDGNHPLAGEDLVFDLELVNIAAPPSRIIMP
jgi:FKBP-type peptidyl-prolyl cis-trans isomerase 2